MKKIIETQGEGYESLLGEQVLVFCMNYIYTGNLAGVADDQLLLSNPYIVYETGAFDKSTFTDAQKLPFNIFISTNSIESIGKTDKRA